MYKGKAYKVELSIAADIDKAIKKAESAAKSVKQTVGTMNSRAKSNVASIAGVAGEAYKELVRQEKIIDQQVKLIEEDIKEFEKAGLDSSTLRGLLGDIEQGIKYNKDWLDKIWKVSRL